MSESAVSELFAAFLEGARKEAASLGKYNIYYTCHDLQTGKRLCKAKSCCAALPVLSITARAKAMYLREAHRETTAKLPPFTRPHVLTALCCYTPKLLLCCGKFPLLGAAIVQVNGGRAGVPAAASMSDGKH